MTALKKPVPFGKYYLLERINVGGMAEVFKAKAFGVEGFERLLAVKRILPNIAEDEEFITMFIDEAKIAVQLKHANIAQIFDLGKVDDSYFIALEYVHGNDLRAIFDRMRSKARAAADRAWPATSSCRSARGSTTRTTSATRQGRELHLVHRDVSPQNVLISLRGRGQADRLRHRQGGRQGVQDPGRASSRASSATCRPSRCAACRSTGAATSSRVGIVLYELLTGERLFVGESDFSTLEKVRNVEILPPSTYNRKIPQELERIVLKALAQAIAEDRYQNAIDLHDDLQAFLYSAGEFYSRKDLAAWMKKTFARRSRRRPRSSSSTGRSRRRSPLERRGVAPRRRRRGAARASGRDRRAAGAAAKAPPPKGSQPPAAVHQAMGWDDEELDTQIFDKEEVKPVAAEDLFFEDDDRTVANEPAPDILEQARPPELLTPKPVRADAAAERGHQDDAAADGAAAAAAARRAPADAGRASPAAAGAARRRSRAGPVPTLPPPLPGPPPGRVAGLRRSG